MISGGLISSKWGYNTDMAVYGATDRISNF